MAVINNNFYSMPIVVGKITDRTQKKVDLERFAGTCFFINSQGLIVTCAHVLESIKQGEVLFAKNFVLNTFLPLTDIKVHPTMDFGCARVEVTNNEFYKPYGEELHMGISARTTGYNGEGRHGKNLRIINRMMVGHIVSITEKPSKTLRANSVCELSFPVTAGFSGAAVISSDQVDKFQLIGMLYSNLESSIQVHSFIDYKNEIEREKEKETIVKVTEFGLMHSIYDIKQFLDDMGIKDIFV